MISREASLQTLHASLADARHGYEDALKNDPDSDLAPLFRRMTVLHLAAGDEVAQLLETLGVEADKDSSFLSTAGPPVSDPEISGRGEDRIRSLVRGEENTLARYDAALDAAGMLDGVEAPLRAQRERLAAAVADMRQVSSMA